MTDRNSSNEFGAARQPEPMPDFEAFEELSGLDDSELAAILRDLENFRDRVYWLVRQIPRGRVATYGQIALYAGSPRAARAVGNLMKSSVERGITLPWHRVINAEGRISHRGDLERPRRQRRWLEREGIEFDDNDRCDLDRFRWEPDVVFWDNDET